MPSHASQYARCGDPECACNADPWYDTLDPIWHQLRDFCRHKLLHGNRPNRLHARRCMKMAMSYISKELREEEEAFSSGMATSQYASLVADDENEDDESDGGEETDGWTRTSLATPEEMEMYFSRRKDAAEAMKASKMKELKKTKKAAPRGGPLPPRRRPAPRGTGPRPRGPGPGYLPGARRRTAAH